MKSGVKAPIDFIDNADRFYMDGEGDISDDFGTGLSSKPQPPTGTAEAMATMVEHEMKKGKNSSFIYYNEKKIDK